MSLAAAVPGSPLHGGLERARAWRGEEQCLGQGVEAAHHAGGGAGSRATVGLASNGGDEHALLRIAPLSMLHVELKKGAGLHASNRPAALPSRWAKARFRQLVG